MLPEEVEKVEKNLLITFAGFYKLRERKKERERNISWYNKQLFDWVELGGEERGLQAVVLSQELHFNAVVPSTPAYTPEKQDNLNHLSWE